LTRHFRDDFGVPSIVHICGNVKSLGGLAESQLKPSASIQWSESGLRELAPGSVTMGNISTFLLEKELRKR
jgi:[methyl-Co(III) methanol-specific corrinoid protein]:coenzyme M methyltransferase